MNPLIAVVIPTYERPGPLGRCLEAVATQTLRRDEYQVIVVDDGSSCDVEACVEPYRSRVQLKLLRQQNEGPAAARNRGIHAADGELIALTDDDCEPRQDWLERLRGRLVAEGESCMVGGGIVNLLNDNLFSETAQLILDLVYDHYNHDPEKAHFFASMNVGIPKAGFLACGGFSSDFRTAEDREFCDRWRSSGHRLVYEPGAEIGHAHRLDLRSFCRQSLGYGRGAYHYHQVRRERSSGSMLGESGNFYLALPGLVLRRLYRRRVGRAAKHLAILALWQVFNAAGYFAGRWSPGDG